MNKPVFQFQKRRDFGAVIGDSLQFVVQHFKSLLTGFLLYVGPFFLIGAIVQTMSARDLNLVFDTFPVQFGLGLIFFMVMAFVATIMLMAMVFGGVDKYLERPEESLIEGLWPYMKRYLSRLIIASLVIALIYTVFLGAITGVAFLLGPIFVVFLFLLLVPLMIYLAIPMVFVPYIYVHEQVDLVTSIRRAFYLVKENWWSTFAVYLVISILASVVSSIFVMPIYVIYIVKMLGSGMDMATEMNHGMWLGLIYAFALLGSLFASIYQLIGVILQYYNLREKKEGTGLMERIQEIGGSDELV